MVAGLKMQKSNNLSIVNMINAKLQRSAIFLFLVNASFVPTNVGFVFFLAICI